MRIKKSRKGAKPRRIDSRRYAPPRWMLVGALAASTALSRTASADDAARLTAIIARADGLPVPFAATATAAPPPKGWRLAAFAAADATLGRAPRSGAAAAAPRDVPVLQFAIPAGPLGPALDAFATVAGVSLQLTDAIIRELPSPGVSGLLTAEQALRSLLEGSGARYRFSRDGAVTIELEGVAETIAVTDTDLLASPKLTEPLRDTPQTITVVPRSVIEAQGASSLRDVLRNVTGISIQAGEGGGGLPGDNLSIRGFAARNDIFVDGVRDFGAYTRDPFNVEQVEVVKGPASALGGRGSTGGSVNLRSKAPLLSGLRDFTVAGGTDDYQRATVDFNQPLASSPLPGTALRLNAMWTEGDVAGRDAVNNQRWAIAPSIAVGLGTATRATLSYSRLEQDNLPEYGIPWVPASNVPLAEHADQPAPVDFDNFYGLIERDYERTVTGLTTATVEHDLTDRVQVRSVLRHGQSDRDSLITAPRFASTESTVINRQLQSRDLEDEIVASQTDLTARFATGALRHALVAGVEIVRESAVNHTRTRPDAPQTDLFDPNPADPYDEPVVRTGARTESDAATTAAYVFDTVAISERLEAVGGVRFDRFRSEYVAIAVDQTRSKLERTDEVASWRAGLVGKPRPNGSVYLGYGTSFNPAAEGNTGLSLNATTADLAPEESRSLELGTKWDHTELGLSWSAALFRTDKTNARTPGVAADDPPTVLQGEQRVEGLELGVTGSVAPGWTVYGGYTWMQSEILESNNPAERGNDMPNTPEHSFSLWTTYQLGRLELGGGVQHVGDRYNNAANARIAPGYWLADATAAVEVNQRLTLRLNVNNLADERYIDRVGGGHFIPGNGRSASVTAIAHF